MRINELLILRMIWTQVDLNTIDLYQDLDLTPSSVVRARSPSASETLSLENTALPNNGEFSLGGLILG